MTDSSDLGQVEATYLPEARSVRASRVGGIVFYVLGGAAIVAGIVLAFSETVLLCFIPAGIAGIAAGYSSLRRGREQATMVVRIHEHGLAYEHSGQTDVYRWKDLAEFWQQVITRSYRGGLTQTAHTFRITDKQGRKAIFDDRLVDVGDLGRDIARGSLPALYADAVARRAAGETLSFGKLTMTQQELVHGRRHLPLSEVASAQLSGNRLFIERIGKKAYWGQILVSDVPNVFVLVALLDHIKGAQER